MLSNSNFYYVIAAVCLASAVHMFDLEAWKSLVVVIGLAGAIWGYIIGFHYAREAARNDHS